MSIATMTVTLDANTGQFTTQIQTATGQIQTFNSAVGRASDGINRMERSAGGLVAGLRDGMVILGQFRAAMYTVWAFTGQWVMGIIDANAQLERLQQLMTGVSTATTQAGRALEAEQGMEYVIETAKNAPFALNELANSFVKLKSAGIDPTKGAMDALTNSVAAFGGDDQVFHRATIAIQQMAGKGVISMEELRQQLGEAVPDAMKLMARSANMTVGELVKAISTGTVASGDALERMFDEMRIKHGGAAAQMMTTWTGLISQLKTEWLVFAKEIGGDPNSQDSMFGAAKGGLRELIDLLRSPEGKQAAREFGQALASMINGLVSMTRWIVQNRDMLVELGKAALIAFTGFKVASLAAQFGDLVGSVAGVVRQVGVLGAVLPRLNMLFAGLGGPVGIAIGAIAGLGLALWDHVRAANAANEALTEFYATMRNGTAAPAEEGLAQAQAQLESVKAAIDGINEKLRTTGTSRNQAIGYAILQGNAVLESMGWETREGPDALKQIRADLELAYRTIESNVREGNARLERDQEKSAIAKWIEGLSQGSQDSLDALDVELNRIGEALGKTMTKAEASTARVEAISKTYNQIISNLTSQKEVVEDQMRARGETFETAPENIKTAYLAAVRAINEATEARDRLVENAKTDLERLNTPPKSVDQLIKENRLQSFLAQTEARVAQFEAQLDDASPSLARFRELLSNGQFGKDYDKGIAAQIEAALVKADELKAKVDDMRAVEKVFSDLDNISAKATADLQTARDRSSGDVYSEVSRGMAGFNRQVEVLRQEVIRSNGDLLEFEARVASIRNEVAQTDLLTFTRDMQEIGAAAREAIMTPREAARSALDRQLAENRARLEQILAQHVGNEEKITEAERIELETRKALQEQFAFENRTALQRWIDDYKDITEELDQTWANAMDSITDSIMQMVETGKFSFKDLATSILKEIARVVTARVVAQFAEMMMSAFSGGQGMFGAKGGTVGSSYQPFGGGTPDPKMALSSSVPSFGKSAVGEIGSTQALNAATPAVPGNVIINLTNQSGEQMEAEETGRRFDGKQMILDIVLSAASRPGRFRDGMKGALT